MQMLLYNVSNYIQVHVIKEQVLVKQLAIGCIQVGYRHTLLCIG